jgi:tetratricopeptide (TPR) repeat protein
VLATLALRALLLLVVLASACAATRGARPPTTDVTAGSTMRNGEAHTAGGDRGVPAREDDAHPGAAREDDAHPGAARKDDMRAAGPIDEAATAGPDGAAGREEPVQSAAVRPPEIAPRAVGPAVEDDGSLVAKIDRATPPRRAAALRLTEQGRAHLAAGEPARAIEILERAVAIDARSPYAYYFLAQAHVEARHPGMARSFVARAEQLFAGNPYWLGRAHALHGRLAEDGGRIDEARAEYTRALAVWPQNADASSGLARLDAAGQGAR